MIVMPSSVSGSQEIERRLVSVIGAGLDIAARDD